MYAIILYNIHNHRSTIMHFGNLENKSRRILHQHISNQLAGRAVIQSFDKIEDSRNRYHYRIPTLTA